MEGWEVCRGNPRRLGLKAWVDAATVGTALVFWRDLLWELPPERGTVVLTGCLGVSQLVLTWWRHRASALVGAASVAVLAGRRQTAASGLALSVGARFLSGQPGFISPTWLAPALECVEYAVPVVAYLELTPARIADRCALSALCWAGIATRLGPRKFLESHWPHDTHATVACVALVLGSHNADAVLSLSFGYFLVDLATCAACKDAMFAAHAGIALFLVTACLAEDDYAIHAAGARVLLVEASTPLMHYWQRRKSAASYALFLAVFFVARCVFLPLHTAHVFRLVLSARALVLVPLNLLQFVWFAYLAHMWATKHPAVTDPDLISKSQSSPTATTTTRRRDPSSPESSPDRPRRRR